MNQSLKGNNIYFLMVLFLSIVMSIVYASFDSMIVMEQKWSGQEEYGYAYIVPFVTAFFIWQRLESLSKVDFKFSYLGAFLLTGALFVVLLGVLSATHSITQYGVVISVIACSFMLLGVAATRVILGPLLLLFLIVPLPAFIFNNLSSFLQLVSSEIGVAVIRLFGISVYLEGNVIDLGEFQLQVVEACSGLRYLFPLLSLSIITAFMYKEALWKRVVLILSSLPITVFMNSFRIGVIGVLVEYGGIEQAEGFLHDFEGWIIFMACTALLVLEMWVFHLIGSDNKAFSEVFNLDIPENKELEFKVYDLKITHIIIVAVVMLASLGISVADEREEIIPERMGFSDYPLKLGDWNGRPDVIEKKYLDELKLNDYIIADYRNERGDSVNLYLAYYETQRSGAAAHSPRSCIPGGGWRIKSHSTINIEGLEKSTNRLLIRKGDYGQLVYYWFDQRGRNITNEYMVKWYLFWDSFTLGRTDGALVRVTTTLKPGEDVAQADKRLSEFTLLIQPTLSEYIPE